MYSTKKSSMTVQVQVYMWHKTTSTEALLDSGATHNFIDERAIQTLGMGTRELPQPLQVNTVDGTANPVTHFCNLWLRQGEKTVKQGFYVTNLGKGRIILPTTSQMLLRAEPSGIPRNNCRRKQTLP